MNITTEEAWKSIEGFPGYEVSDRGRVRSYRRNGNGGIRPEPRLMNIGKRPNGYPYVSLCCDGKKARFSIHRLVLVVFGPPRPPGTEASHVDGNQENVAIGNLVWESHKDNLARRSQHGTLQRGENHSNAKLTEAEVAEIRSLWKSGEIGKMKIAKRFNVTYENIRWIARGAGWKHAA